MNCAISSRLTFVSSMDAEIPGSRLRSEMDIRRGESAGLDGDTEPRADSLEDVRIGTGLFCSFGCSCAGSSPPVSSKNGSGSDFSGSGIGVWLGSRSCVRGTGMSAISKDCVEGVASMDCGRCRCGCSSLDSSCSMIPCSERPRCIATGCGE